MLRPALPGTDAISRANLTADWLPEVPALAGFLTPIVCQLYQTDCCRRPTLCFRKGRSVSGKEFVLLAPALWAGDMLDERIRLAATGAGGRRFLATSPVAGYRDRPRRRLANGRAQGFLHPGRSADRACAGGSEAIRSLPPLAGHPAPAELEWADHPGGGLALHGLPPK